MMRKGFSGNQLKLIALVTMTIDHIGYVLFPRILWFRLVGRLAFPIYAFLVAEGCLHTRSMPKYLRSMGLMALLCQAVYLVAMGSLYQCILVTFSLSIVLCMVVKKTKEEKTLIWYFLTVIAILTVWLLTEVLPLYLHHTDYGVDYGFWGVMLPVVLYLAPRKRFKLVLTAGILLLMSSANWVQLPSVLAVFFLAMYNGTRGKWNLKHGFYWYYPIHLVVIYGISLL